jgi:hypothetical protein
MNHFENECLAYLRTKLSYYIYFLKKIGEGRNFEVITCHITLISSIKMTNCMFGLAASLTKSR